MAGSGVLAGGQWREGGWVEGLAASADMSRRRDIGIGRPHIDNIAPHTYHIDDRHTHRLHIDDIPVMILEVNLATEGGGNK